MLNKIKKYTLLTLLIFAQAANVNSMSYLKLDNIKKVVSSIPSLFFDEVLTTAQWKDLKKLAIDYSVILVPAAAYWLSKSRDVRWLCLLPLCINAIVNMYPPMHGLNRDLAPYRTVTNLGMFFYAVISFLREEHARLKNLNYVYKSL